MSKIFREQQLGTTQRWVPQVITAPDALPQVINAAENLLREAHTQAEAILAAAQQEAKYIEATAFQAGHAAGLEVAHTECLVLKEELNEQRQEMTQERDHFFQRIEPEVVQLAVTIAEKILTEQLTLNPEWIIRITRAQLLRIREREVLTIRVNPADLPYLRDAKDSILGEIDGIRNLQLMEDRRVDQGGVVFETVSGSLDARISSQLAVIGNDLVNATEIQCDESGV